jgi:hypothetical protein
MRPLRERRYRCLGQIGNDVCAYLTSRYFFARFFRGVGASGSSCRRSACINPIRAIIVGPPCSATSISACIAARCPPFRRVVLGLRQLRDVSAGVAQGERSRPLPGEVRRERLSADKMYSFKYRQAARPNPLRFP